MVNYKHAILRLEHFMPIYIRNHDYLKIANMVKNDTLDLLKSFDLNDDIALLKEVHLGREFLAKPTRVSTPHTHVLDMEKDSKLFRSIIENELKKIKDPQERKQKEAHLNGIILFGQLLFSKNASELFADKTLLALESLDLDSLVMEKFEKSFRKLRKIIANSTFNKNPTRSESIQQRKEFNDAFAELRLQLKSEIQGKIDYKKEAKIHLYLRNMEGFYQQMNDLNHKHAIPEGRFNNLMDSLIRNGQKVSLASALVAMGSVALSFFFPAFIPIAIAATVISIGASTPFLLRALTNSVGNWLFHRVAPIKSDLGSLGLVATTLGTMGVGVVARPIIAESITALNNITKEVVLFKETNFSERTEAKQFNQTKNRFQQLKKAPDVLNLMGLLSEHKPSLGQG